MFTSKHYELLKNNGFSFELSSNQNLAIIDHNKQYFTHISNTACPVLFSCEEKINTNGYEIIKFLRNNW